MSYRRWVLAAGILVVAGFHPAPALAASIFVQAGAGGAASGTYSLSVSYFSPSGLSIMDTGPLNDTMASYSPGSAAAGLTDIQLAAAVSGTASGSSTAGADLRTGTVRATASSDTYQSRGTGFAELNDDLTFSVAGGGSQQITVVAHLDGMIGSFANAFSLSGLSYILNFGTASNLVYLSQGSQSGFTFSAGGASSNTPVGWDSYAISGLTGTGFDFTGLLTIRDGETRALRQQLYLNCQEGVNCDFAHTGSIAMQLPSGVSFTSGSGVFLSPPLPSGVPEPTTWAMLIVGFGLAGGAIRKRRSAADRQRRWQAVRGY